MIQTVYNIVLNGMANFTELDLVGFKEYTYTLTILKSSLGNSCSEKRRNISRSQCGSQISEFQPE